MAAQAPSTVSFAILGQLSIRPHSAYELARLGRRWRDIFWTTSESVIYGELKNLVGLGLSTERTEWNGGRKRTVYRITPKGRRALARWLAAPSAAPSIQHEAMLKVLFCTAGTKADVLRAIGTVRAWAEDRVAEGREIAAGYLDGTAPYPERAPVVALTFAYQFSQAEQMRTWAEWAVAEVSRWPETGLPARAATEAFERATARGRS